ncbi:MAG: hypothetical protein EAY65_01435 [Alphaproteobacteria bacterium]|nr:MAG: hypothetical protein EAY65_01435 [Alphaproteobacteria bacterium]
MKYVSDKLNRPLPDKEVSDLPLASQTLVAGLWHRIFAFVLDFLTVSSLYLIAIVPLLRAYYFGDHRVVSPYAFRAALLSYVALAMIYVVNFTCSPLRATLGQRLVGVYVTHLLGWRVSVMIAVVRFVICYAPFIIFCAIFTELFADMFHLIGWRDAQQISLEREFFYPMLFIIVVMQSALWWPLCTGHPHRVGWDRWTNTTLLRRKIARG